jgi:hypothetical protein
LKRNKKISRIAVVLAVVFVGSLLTKSLHVLLPADENTTCHSDLGHKDCAVCNFSFSNFTSQNISHIEKPLVFPVEIVFVKQFFFFFQKQFSTLSLRAPPVF